MDAAVGSLAHNLAVRARVLDVHGGLCVGGEHIQCVHQQVELQPDHAPWRRAVEVCKALRGMALRSDSGHNMCSEACSMNYDSKEVRWLGQVTGGDQSHVVVGAG